MWFSPLLLLSFSYDECAHLFILDFFLINETFHYKMLPIYQSFSSAPPYGIFFSGVIFCASIKKENLSWFSLSQTAIFDVLS